MPTTTPPQPSITCPQCGMTSYHPMDVRTGYCGNCHDYTSPGTDGDLRARPACPDCGHPETNFACG